MNIHIIAPRIVAYAAGGLWRQSCPVQVIRPLRRSRPATAAEIATGTAWA